MLARCCFYQLKISVVVGLLLIFAANASAQQQKLELLINKIDSLTAEGLPKSALKKVDKLDELARKNHNAPQQIRAAVYRMNLQTYIEENALTAIINRLKLDIKQANFPVKPVLQSILAQVYWNYYQQNRFQFARRSTLEKPDEDFTHWDLRTVVQQVERLYQQSTQNRQQLQNTPVSVLEGVLEGDKSTRYLRPTLYDLLAQRALDFYLQEEPDLPKTRMTFSLNDPRFFADDAVFINLKLPANDTSSVVYHGLKLLQQTANFHLQKQQTEALASVDLQRLEFLHRKADLPQKDSLYRNALQNISEKFKTKPIAADALVLLAQFHQQKDSLVLAVADLQKAIKNYPKSFGAKNAILLLQQINQQSLSAEIESVNVPDEPILARLNYKNLQKANATIYELNNEQVGELKALQEYNYGRDEVNFNLKMLHYLKQLPNLRQNPIDLPDFKDYREHHVEFKIEPLKRGFYVLLLSAKNMADSSLISVASFQVSNLAYAARQNPDSDEEIRTLNRKTGKPMPGVQVSVFDHEQRKVVASGVSDASGKFGFHTLRNSTVEVDLSVSGDFYAESKSFYGVSYNNNSSYYYEQTILFTDRQLYRPGQTIYFKGLQIITRNNKSEIVKDEVNLIKLTDANNKELGLVKVKTNEFGTFNGSFILPQTLLNGEVYLRTENGGLDVKVEEYKRPTFNIQFEAIKEAYHPGDSIKVKGKVLSFAGFGLADASVKVNVNLSQINISKQPQFNRINNIYIPKPTDFLSDTIKTNGKGEFTIRFKAVSYPKLELLSYYRIQAEVTDASGETHSANTTINVATQPLKIQFQVPYKLLVTDSLKFAASLVNVNEQLQNGNLILKMFSLKRPNNQITKIRLWQKPEQYLGTKEEFKKDFSTYAWKNEDEPSAWQKDKLVLQTELKVDSNRFSIADLSKLKQQVSGFYRIEIAAKNSIGDTISTVQFTQLINQNIDPITMQDWAVPLIVKAAAGGRVVFGLMAGIHVLAEVIDNEKLISSEWISTGKTAIKKEFLIPVNASNKLHVQFLMAKDNRVYNLLQPIKIIRNEPQLTIKLLSFYNKLQPGEKEQWKLQISGNEKQSVEMLATMYDASLDELAPAQNWNQKLEHLSLDYQPNYYAWNVYNLIHVKQTQQVIFKSSNFDLLVRQYEKLNLLNFNYYGGYNSAYKRLGDITILRKKMVQLYEADYQKSVAAFKNGFDVKGRVISFEEQRGLAGVSIMIKGTDIGTQTDAGGYFKLRLPIKGVLICADFGYFSQEVNVVKSVLPVIKLKRNGIILGGEKSLNEVVVVGYGTQAKRDASSAIVSEANESVSFAAVSTVTKDGTLIENGKIVGKVMIRGSQEKNVNSQIENFNQNVIPQNPIITRKNFNETAFFYPQLRTNEKGEILLNFTMPEALTRWRFKALAQTPQLQFAYQEKEIITQKQVMVSANMPRFFREGDTITVSATVANLNTEKVSVKAALQLFNAMNMQSVNLLANASESNQIIDIEANTNKVVSFKLIIPQGLDALTYRLTADAGKYSDGEENTIPVLTNAMLVTESVPMMVRPNQTKTFTLEKLLHNQSSTLQNKSLTLEYTENPAWYAVQALPYLMEFPYECAEQTFNRYFANSLGTTLLKKLPAVQQVFERWKQTDSKELISNLEKNQDLKSVLIEETPWLRDAQDETEQKKRIALLFDLNKMSYELQHNLNKLKEMQLANGSFPWFAGWRSDRYITQYILEGIGKLYETNTVDAQSQTLKSISEKALNYLDQELIKPEHTVFIGKKLVSNLSSIEIHGWYARSYFAGKPMSERLQTAWKNYQQKANAEWLTLDTYEKGLIALTFQHFKLIKEAQQIVKSLTETAQQSEEMGMYWPKNQLGYYWYQNPVETQSLLIELFSAAGKTKEVEEMKIWLLRNKQTNNWKTTISTASACYALLLRGENWLASTGKTELFLGGENLQKLKPGLKPEAGTGYLKTSWQNEQIKPEFGKVEAKNQGKTISWGALYWQYLERLDKISSAKNSISLERRYFIRSKNNNGEVLVAVDQNHQPKVGDLLKIVVYLKADRDFEYVHLKDMRPAGTEPVDVLSGYKYQDGLPYYQVTKDVATNFFISSLPKGNYVFEYGLRVAQPGNFSTGISSVQSMYAPEFGAHSEGKRISTVK